jgi:hypothetical protein
MARIPVRGVPAGKGPAHPSWPTDLDVGTM